MSPLLARQSRLVAMMIDVDRFGSFELSADFLEPYRQRPVPWGFGALSWITYLRTYSREGEAWWQTCRRVIDGLHDSGHRAADSPIKTTSVKPFGTVSLLAGATPGVHWDHAPFYIRRVRVTASHPLAEMCRQAGYDVEADRYSSQTSVISFPIAVSHAGRRKADVPLWEKVDLAAQLQAHWSDNQVSCTAEFDPDREAAHLPRILEAYEDRLKAIAFLPAATHGYEQAPYEEISRERYKELTAAIKPLAGELSHEEELEERYCDGGVCDVAVHQVEE